MSQAPVSSRASRLYESRVEPCRPWEISAIRNSPGGNRTRFCGLRGLCPKPVDEQGLSQTGVGGEGVEPFAYRLTSLMATALQAAVRNTTREIPLRWHGWESNPQAPKV